MVTPSWSGDRAARSKRRATDGTAPLARKSKELRCAAMALGGRRTPPFYEEPKVYERRQGLERRTLEGRRLEGRRRFSERRDAVLRADLLQRRVGDRKGVPVVAQVHLAGGAPLRRAQHLGDVEQARVAGRHGRHLDVEMELDDGEHQERETVFAHEPALERALLDLAPRRRVVAG